MRLFKKKTDDEVRQPRARSLGEAPNTPSAFSYHSSRSNRPDSSSNNSRATLMEAEEGISKFDYRSKRRLILAHFDDSLRRSKQLNIFNIPN